MTAERPRRGLPPDPAGALHRANGGFLVLRASDLEQTEAAWAGAQARAAGPGDSAWRRASGAPRCPRPPCARRPFRSIVKVVLIGTEEVYQMLFALDPEFPRPLQGQGRVRAGCALVGRGDAALRGLPEPLRARPLAAAARRRRHRAHHRARLAHRRGQQRISVRLGELADLATEASFWASKAGRPQVTRADVDRALHARHARSGLLERRLRAEMTRRTVLVQTAGEVLGQVNGLAVVELGDSRFAVPARITATVYPGRGTLLSVDGAAELSGPFHDKAVLILLGYLARPTAAGAPSPSPPRSPSSSRTAPSRATRPRSPSCSPCSRSLADVPLDQGIAVTGAVDQRGQIEPVGEVTRKVEGFFAACRAAGLDGPPGRGRPGRPTRCTSCSTRRWSRPCARGASTCGR
jgi:hypothetical protein